MQTYGRWALHVVLAEIKFFKFISQCIRLPFFLSSTFSIKWNLNFLKWEKTLTESKTFQGKTAY